MVSHVEDEVSRLYMVQAHHRVDRGPLIRSPRNFKL